MNVQPTYYRYVWRNDYNPCLACAPSTTDAFDCDMCAKTIHEDDATVTCLGCGEGFHERCLIYLGFHVCAAAPGTTIDRSVGMDRMVLAIALGIQQVYWQVTIQAKDARHQTDS